jgi:KUP system potassium uptake protein
LCVLLEQKHYILIWDIAENIQLVGFCKTAFNSELFLVKLLFLIHHEGETLSLGGEMKPIYPMADWFQPFGIIIATMAAVIASQALISGSFTLINEATRLNFWPKVRIKYPRSTRSVVYSFY